MKDMEKRSVNLEIRSLNEEERKIEGYAAVFSENYTQLSDRRGDKFYEKISPGAFAKTLREKTNNIFMLINHDWNKVVGRRGSNLILEEDSVGLRFELTVPNTTDGNDLLENVRSGLIQGCSFGFKITNQREKWDETYTNFYRDITEVELFEVTATPMPAYADTAISVRSELSIRDLREEAKSKDPKEKNDNNEVLTKNANLLASFFMQKNN